MSKCISAEGEFSEHEMGRDGTFYCMLCGAFDDERVLRQLKETRERADAAEAKVARVEAELDSAGPLEHGVRCGSRYGHHPCNCVLNRLTAALDGDTPGFVWGANGFEIEAGS